MRPILFSLCLAAVGCASALARPTQDDAAWASQRFPGMTLVQLDAGRRAYTRRCAGCHTLRLPEEFAPESWPLLLDAMEQRQGVVFLPGERQEIGRFLSVMSARLRLAGR